MNPLGTQTEDAELPVPGFGVVVWVFWARTCGFVPKIEKNNCLRENLYDDLMTE